MGEWACGLIGGRTSCQYASATCFGVILAQRPWVGTIKQREKTRQDILTRDAMVAPRQVRDPKYKRTTAERSTLWSGERIVNTEKSAHGHKRTRKSWIFYSRSIHSRKFSREGNPKHTEKTKNEEEQPSPPWKKQEEDMNCTP